MKQGTGKTRVAIELANSTDATLVLFLVPNQLKQNMLEQIELWQLNKPFVIETYEGISQSDRRYLELLSKLENEKVMIVADESIFIKNGSSKRYNRILNIRDKSEYRLILNGTPITKNEWDIYYQMKFLSDRIIKMNESEFLATFFKKVKYKKKFQKPHEFYKLSEVNIDYLKRLIEPYIFEVDLEFDKDESDQYKIIYSSSETEEKYQQLKEKLLEKIEHGETFQDLLMLMCYEMFTDRGRNKEIGESLKGQQIVYCCYLKEVEVIAAHCDCYVITGDTPIDERVCILKQFKEDNKPLLMTYGVGAFGHNLQFCNKITFASITFDYAKVDQAKYRIKRLGQERNIKYTYIKSDLGIYNLIQNNLVNKENLHDLIIKNLHKMKEVL